MFVIFLPVSAKNMPSIIAFMMETKFPEKNKEKACFRKRAAEAATEPAGISGRAV